PVNTPTAVVIQIYRPKPTQRNRQHLRPKPFTVFPGAERLAFGAEQELGDLTATALGGNDERGVLQRKQNLAVTNRPPRHGKLDLRKVGIHRQKIRRITHAARRPGGRLNCGSPGTNALPRSGSVELLRFAGTQPLINFAARLERPNAA